MPGVTMMHHATKRGFKDCPKCAPLAHPLKGHRWGTGPKRCQTRARRANVPPIGKFQRRRILPRLGVLVWFGLALGAPRRKNASVVADSVEAFTNL